MKRAIVVVVALAFAESGADADPLDAALASREAVLAALAPAVTLGPVAWSDPACEALGPRVTGEARGTLAGCVAALRLTRAKLATGSPVAAIGPSGAVVAITWSAGKLAGFGPAAPAKGEAFATVLRWWVNRDLVPSEQTRQAIARTAGKRAEATLKICHDDQGALVSRRIVHASGVPGFDAEALAYFQGLERVEPYQRGGTPVPACSILALRYPDVLGGG